MTHVATNDNVPRRAADFADLAARRAWIAARPDKTKAVLAWPTAERLARQDKRLAAVLVRYRELVAPGKFIAANDNADTGDADAIREIRPSLKELAAAVDEDLEVHFPTREAANAGWSVRMVDGHLVCHQGEYTYLGSLLFLRGALVSYDRFVGKDDKSRTSRPRELWRRPKGAKAKPRTKAAVRFLVSDDTPIAKGAIFLAGAVGRKGNTASAATQMTGEEDDRVARCKAVRETLGSNFWLLDRALTDASAVEIGREMGLEGKRAERRAIQAINDALKKIEKLVA